MRCVTDEIGFLGFLRDLKIFRDMFLQLFGNEPGILGRRVVCLIQDDSLPKQAVISPIRTSEESKSTVEETKCVASSKDSSQCEHEKATFTVDRAVIPGTHSERANKFSIMSAYRSPVSFLYTDPAAELRKATTLNATTTAVCHRCLTERKEMP